MPEGPGRAVLRGPREYDPGQGRLGQEAEAPTAGERGEWRRGLRPALDEAPRPHAAPRPDLRMARLRPRRRARPPQRRARLPLAAWIRHGQPDVAVRLTPQPDQCPPALDRRAGAVAAPPSILLVLRGARTRTCGPGESGSAVRSRKWWKSSGAARGPRPTRTSGFHAQRFLFMSQRPSCQRHSNVPPKLRVAVAVSPATSTWVIWAERISSTTFGSRMNRPMK
jgi:hypothetical protein